MIVADGSGDDRASDFILRGVGWRSVSAVSFSLVSLGIAGNFKKPFDPGLCDERRVELDRDRGDLEVDVEGGNSSRVRQNLRERAQSHRRDLLKPVDTREPPA